MKFDVDLSAYFNAPGQTAVFKGEITYPEKGKILYGGVTYIELDSIMDTDV